jgi:hypothetical protein
MALAIAHSRGWLDYDERVATYWPEFAQHGKARITVRQLLAHQAGLSALDEPIDRHLAACASMGKSPRMWEIVRAARVNSAALVTSINKCAPDVVVIASCRDRTSAAICAFVSPDAHGRHRTT